jgi:hypothetical protein
MDCEKFAYFALSMVWRRTIHEWHPAIRKWELGQFAINMRRYLAGESSFPEENTAVIIIVCSDMVSRNVRTVPTELLRRAA